MKLYHIRKSEDTKDLIENENCLVVCNKTHFKEVHKKFNLINAHEHTKRVKIDPIHFESYMDHDVISFVFFNWNKNHLVFEEVHLYIGLDFIIFVCDHKDKIIDTILEGINIDLDYQANGVKTLTFIYYRILDRLISEMFFALDEFETYLVSAETNLIDPNTSNSIDEISLIKNISFEVKKKLRLLTYIGDQIIANDNNLIEEKYIKYFKNISVKMNRLFEFGSSIHERTDHLMDLYNTSVSDRSNAFLNKLTLISFFATPITVLSGIYGMNFMFMPELTFKYSYFILLSVIVIIQVSIYTYLKKSKML